MRHLWFLITLCCASLALATAPDPVFPDVRALASTPLNAKVISTAEKDGIVLEEVIYHSEMDGEKSVDIFAIFGYPKGAKRLPAFVWNQGGLGQASDYWVLYGAKRGYAVLCIDFPMPGYRSTGGYPIVSGLALGDDPAKAPIAHGAVALLKAVTYLESRPEVDRRRIGMAGSSWGGFYTTLMVGLDRRLKAGSCFFGAGSLQLGCSWFQGSGIVPPAAWATTLDPAWRLARVKTPLNWCTGTNDTFYWMPALMQTHALAAGPKHLALLPNRNHELTPALDEEVFAWLDVYLQGHPAFPRVSHVTVAQRGGDLIAGWTFDCPRGRQVVAADLIYSEGAAGRWGSRRWTTLPAAIAGARCEATLPATAAPCVLGGAVIDADGYRHSTPLLEIGAVQLK